MRSIDSPHGLYLIVIVLGKFRFVENERARVTGAVGRELYNTHAKNTNPCTAVQGRSPFKNQTCFARAHPLIFPLSKVGTWICNRITCIYSLIHSKSEAFGYVDYVRTYLRLNLSKRRKVVRSAVTFKESTLTARAYPDRGQALKYVPGEALRTLKSLIFGVKPHAKTLRVS